MWDYIVLLLSGKQTCLLFMILMSLRLIGKAKGVSNSGKNTVQDFKNKPKIWKHFCHFPMYNWNSIRKEQFLRLVY